MVNLKEGIQKYFEQNDRFIKSEEIKKIFKIKGEEQTDQFFSALNTLIEDGSLFFDAKKGYRLFTNELGFAYGEIEINKNGTGFVHTKDGYTILIENCDLNGALNGDKVIVNSIENKRKDYFHGEVCKILKRKTGNVIFEVIGNGYQASLVPYNKNEYVPININKNQLKKLVDGEIVLVNIGTDKVDDEFVAEISKVIGHKNDANIDIRMIYEKYNVPVEFSKEALDEAENLPTEVSEEEIKEVVDLRDKPIITIDCDGTKDRDDALYVEKLSNGNTKLYVCISAINHYVKRGSKLFEEALERCTSYYPGNTCNPMFPPKLSNGICSLNQNVDRLTKTVEMEFSPSGEMVNYNIYKSVIRSRKEMKYSEVNKVLSGQVVKDYEEHINQLKLLKDLNDNVFEKARINRNCIDYELGDIEKQQDEYGKTKGFTTSGDGIAERIIENCMLAAGTTVAEHFSWMPFMYRIQEAPNPESIKNVIKILRLSGFNIPKFNNIDETTINNILNRIKNTEEADVIRTMLLRATKRAKYSINNIGHFALQLLKYCHFTAPIRRIIDFMIHTIIDEVETFDYSKENIIALEKELEHICERASEMERIAELIEEEVLAMDMAEYMEEHIGETYGGIITEIYQHGMFVKTNNHITGKVKLENMLDDKYRYDDDKKAIIGKRTKKKYQIGNKVCVVVKDACKATRTINFEIGKQKSLRKKS